MAKVYFPKEDISIEIEENQTLLKAIRKAGLKLETPCNSKGFCGKCKVIARGKLSEVSRDELKYIDIEKDERLSCLARIEGDVEVELVDRQDSLKTVNKGFSKDVDLNPSLRKLKLEDPDPKSEKPYLESQGYKLASPRLYKDLGQGENYAIVYEDTIVDLGNKRLLGLAIDIGTTGLSYYLLDLETGETLEKRSSLNPQTEYGGDVITRITYCMEEEKGASKLQEAIVGEINKNIEEITGEKGLEQEQIYHIAIAANTTMNHLLLGVDPSSLAKAPYRPVFLNPGDLKLKDLALKGNPLGILTILPSASSYVGGDIVSGIMASDFHKKKEGLFIDIGTNGELAALKDGQLISTSTAAGPALEGMNIECGCRAEEGAIEKFSLDQDLNISYETIGKKEASGICGSGLMDIAAQLVEKGLVGKSGRFKKNLPEKLDYRLRDKKFYITDKVYISQKDIRQIQLAKGAISAGIILMLEEIGLKIQDIPLAYISGAFGYHIDPQSILTLGLIPKGFKGEIEFLGNTSLEGARLCLLNKNCLEETREIYRKMEVLELSMRENFQDVFVRELTF